MRLCEHPDCHRLIEDDSWYYAWCPDCCENAKCHHGNRPEECDACFHESDLAYDAGRLTVIIKPEEES